MKSTWEEILTPESSPPPEVEVLKILLKAKVRGLPQPYALDSAIVTDDGDLKVETCSFPENQRNSWGRCSQATFLITCRNPWPLVRILSNLH
jgi:hypothetical protein